jgi:membrane protein implicated in regulation of membrane protease activity
MDRMRNLLADVIVGVALLLVAWWVLRRVFGLVLWLVNTLAFAILVVALLVIAGRLRRRRSRKIEC